MADTVIEPTHFLGGTKTNQKFFFLKALVQKE